MALPGYRLFVAASWSLILVGGLHTLGHFAGRPTDPAAEQVFAAMAGYHLPLPFGMEPSVLDVFRDLSLTMAITLVGLGVQNLLVAWYPKVSPPLLRRLAGGTLVVVGALVGLKAFYRISPPLALLTLVEVLFLLAWLRLRAQVVPAAH